MIRKPLAVLILMAAFVGAAGTAQAQALADRVLHHAPALRPRSCDTTVDMTACAAFDFRAADLGMVSAYRAAQAANGGPDLLAAQRTWVAFRDQECAWEGARYGGGTMQGGAIVSWLGEVTKSRTRQLKAAVQP